MTWLAVKILLGDWLKRLSGAIGAVLRWIGAHPWPAAIIALLCLSGALWWHYSGKVEKLSEQLASARAQIEGMKQASAANLSAQLAQKARIEQRYKDLAHDADLEHKSELADANDALRRYIASHRMRAEGSGVDSGAAGSTSEGGSAESGERPGPETELVAVSPDDLQICTTNTMRLIAVRDWAINLSR